MLGATLLTKIQVISSKTRTAYKCFLSTEIDENGEIPAPFCVEKFNFNPHYIMGDFDFIDGKPELMQSKQGFFMDKKDAE